MDSARASRQLRLIAEVVALCDSVGAPVWLRGGWAVDFFLGRVTRDHEDIDWFAWADDAPAIVAALTGHGCRPIPGPPPEQQADLAVDGEELSIGWLRANPAGHAVVAGGRWAGEPWPDGLLEWPPGRIGRVECRIINPSAQIEIKEMTPVWVPGRPRRSKDAVDVGLLRAALDNGSSAQAIGPRSVSPRGGSTTRTTERRPPATMRTHDEIHDENPR